MRRLNLVAFVLAVSLTLCSTRAIAAEPQWKDLFNGKDLTGWKQVGGKPGQWVVEDGILHCKGSEVGGWLGTSDEYANFKVELEFRLKKGGNSGVFLRSPLEGDPAYSGMEIQLLDDAAPEYAHLRPWQYAGSIYGVVASKPRVIKPAGEWQKIDILCDHRHVKVTLNGSVIVDANLDEHKDAVEKHPGLAREKGLIGLQNHTGPLDFRNLRVKVLE